MVKLKVNNVSYDLLADGQLAQVSDWNESLAAALAQRDGITLSTDHWRIVRLMREYYHQFNVSPIRKLLKKMIAARYGAELASDAMLDKLFPRGVQTQGARIAGIPEPKLDAERDKTAYRARRTADPKKVKHFVRTFDFDGRKVDVYPSGNLVHMDDWSESLAEHLAKKEGITLTSDHWELIRFLRKFYFEYGIAPMVRLLVAHLAEHAGKAKSNTAYLYRLFPGGPAKQGSRIAGLPEPQGCIEE